MSTVTVSPEFQIVLPKEIRERAGIQPGQKLEVFRIGDIIELAPVKDMRAMRGSLPGLDTNVLREDGDRI
ncbi:MAG: AbrB/MazE/SpoVT family DNA-binding domain-containing protein [Candidatus Hydrogenedentes bacterium]|nr:AbrB/MazE/SpoVT family DNA-binding domain-containing protein [Candidatus Hydrogenedentota bacterium]